MLIQGLLPIGSVALLKGSTKRLMITGFCQKSVDEDGKIYDYSGVPFPEGYLSADKNLLFNANQIARLYFMGMQDAEQMEHKNRVDAFMSKMREERSEGASGKEEETDIE